jgi:hypothetical protein
MMRARCNNPGYTHYQYYGGRGIRVCAAWNESFQAFLGDMGEPPPGLTLDRIDPEGDYAPGNCRWACREQQAWNTRRSRRVFLDGRESRIPRVAKHLNRSTNWVRSRVLRGQTEFMTGG